MQPKSMLYGSNYEKWGTFHEKWGVKYEGWGEKVRKSKALS
jgi:hypothetical protein